MTRDLRCEGWAFVDKLKMVNQINPFRWIPEITGTIDRDQYDRTHLEHRVPTIT